jgi:hypothetical protein
VDGSGWRYEDFTRTNHEEMHEVLDRTEAGGLNVLSR